MRPSSPMRDVGATRSPVASTHAAALDQRIGDRSAMASSSSEVARREPSSRNSTAMRTATPLRTWSVITDVGQVGDLGGDLDAAVHRAGVHDSACSGSRSARSRVSPKRARVLPQRRHQRLGHAARAACAAGRRRRTSAARRRGRGSPSTGQPSRLGRQQRRRRDERDLGAERGERQDVAAGDPRSA